VGWIYEKINCDGGEGGRGVTVEEKDSDLEKINCKCCHLSFTQEPAVEAGR